MCARYSLALNAGGLQRLLDAEWPGAVPPQDDVRPTNEVLAVGSDHTGRFFRWGLVPRWARDPGIGQKLINARSETAPEKPSFRDAFRKRRCVIPATSFYEWREEPASHVPGQPLLFDDAPRPTHAAPKRKRRYRFSATEPAFLFAGLWESWTPPGAGEDAPPLLTCTILTTAANAAVLPYHDRMPSILQPEDVEAWLDPGLTSEEALGSLLRGLRAEQTVVAPAD